VVKIGGERKKEKRKKMLEVTEADAQVKIEEIDNCVRFSCFSPEFSRSSSVLVLERLPPFHHHDGLSSVLASNSSY